MSLFLAWRCTVKFICQENRKGRWSRSDHKPYPIICHKLFIRTKIISFPLSIVEQHKMTWLFMQNSMPHEKMWSQISYWCQRYRKYSMWHCNLSSFWTTSKRVISESNLVLWQLEDNKYPHSYLCLSLKVQNVTKK